MISGVQGSWNRVFCGLAAGSLFTSGRALDRLFAIQEGPSSLWGWSSPRPVVHFQTAQTQVHPPTRIHQRFQPPEATLFRLDNGLSVWALPRPGLPLVTLSLAVPFGAAHEPLSLAGLSALTASMLDEGTRKRTPIELTDELEGLGASLAVGTGEDWSEIQLQVLQPRLQAALLLLAEILTSPRFAPADFERNKKLTLNELMQREDDPRLVSDVVLRRVFYGEGHPYGHPIEGSPDTVQRVTLATVKGFHHQIWRPEQATLVLTGPLDPAQWKLLLASTLGAWKGRPLETPLPVASTMAFQPRPRVVVVDRPGATQTTLALALPGPTRLNPRYPEWTLLNAVFGGNFTSRIMQNLREKHGFTYGATSALEALAQGGALVATSSVQKEVTGRAVAELVHETRRLRSGDINEEELSRSRATLISDVVRGFETQASALSLFTDLALYGYPPTQLGRYLSQLESVQVSSLNAFAREAVRPEQMILVLVGEAAAILPQLEGLALPTPELLDPAGHPVSPRPKG